MFVCCFAITCSFRHCKGKPMNTVSVFTTWNEPRQPAATSIVVKSVTLSYSMEIKSVVIKDVISSKISDTIEILIECTSLYILIYSVLTSSVYH